ncbi:MAG TPA: hypothetical protein VJ841_01980 [Candidatus Saccharimonadales bacterium]|nr:hypothetical protein [Candidatus Saccharimonadales bacterium]
MKQLQTSSVGWLKTHYRLLLVIGVPVILLVGSMVVSVLVWNGYRNTYLNQKDIVHSRLDRALGLPSSNTEEKAKKLDALSDSAKNLHDYHCDLMDLLRWEAQIVPLYKSWLDECSSVDHKLESLAGALDDFISYMKNDQELSAILQPLLDQSRDVIEKDFSTRYDVWQKAAQQIGGIKEANSFIPIKGVASEAGNGVAGAWKGLVDANNAKDDSSYEAARTTLIKAYSDLGAIKSELDRRTPGIIKAVGDLYTSVF